MRRIGVRTPDSRARGRVVTHETAMILLTAIARETDVAHETASTKTCAFIAVTAVDVADAAASAILVDLTATADGEHTTGRENAAALMAAMVPVHATDNPVATAIARTTAVVDATARILLAPSVEAVAVVHDTGKDLVVSEPPSTLKPTMTVSDDAEAGVTEVAPGMWQPAELKPVVDTLQSFVAPEVLKVSEVPLPPTRQATTMPVTVDVTAEVELTVPGDPADDWTLETVPCALARPIAPVVARVADPVQLTLTLLTPVVGLAR